MTIKYFIAIIVSVVGIYSSCEAGTQEKYTMTVHRTPTCGCCKKWEDHLRTNGFVVKSVVEENLKPIKAKHLVPDAMASCHTGVINGYAFEGHVPADLILKFLKEHPAHAKGLAVPGMPMGSPGMEGATTEKYNVMSFDDKGQTKVFAER